MKYLKLLIVYLLTTFVLMGCFHRGGGNGVIFIPTPPERITITGSGGLGIFDPSITRDPATGKLWMSYSSIDPSVYYPPTVYWAVSIRLASSVDNGTSWQDAGFVVAPHDEQTVGPMAENDPGSMIDAGSQGIWQSETSSLIYDPGAPVNERWKLIWFQYLNADQVNYFADYGWIAMKMASTPEGLEIAAPVKLFVGFGIQPETEISATALLPDIADPPMIQLNAAITHTVGGANATDLNSCVFAEPGLHATNSAIYMAIFCADLSAAPAITEYLVYFRCNSPCNMTSAASWEYLGRLLTPADAQAATGNDHFQAPALVEILGRTFLIVTPVDTTSGNRYNGCRVYELTDVNSNQLERFSGQLLEIRRIDGDAGTHNGACAAYAGLKGGVVLSQFEVMNTPDTFRMYKSQVSLP